MAKVIVTEQYLSDIADAIRAKLGVSDTYTPAQMAGAISSIGGEGEEVIFDDRNQYVTGFLTASDGYTAANRSSTNIIDTYGYTDGKYISSGNLSTNAADTTIGKIPLSLLPQGSTLYIKGYTGAASASHTRINVSSSASYGSGHISEKNGWLASPINPLTVETLGTGYYKVTVGGNWSGYYANATHLGLCFAGTKGADLIITINEPIE